MNKFLFMFLLCFAALSGFSQEINREDEFRQNEVFIELGGNGLLASLNYERQFFKKPGIGFRVGAGVYGTDPHLTIPVGINYLFRFFQSRSFIDVGLGVTYTDYNVQLYTVEKPEPGVVQKEQSFYLIPSVGLKACTSKNFAWRLYITPVLSHSDLLPYIGFGFGKRF